MKSTISIRQPQRRHAHDYPVASADDELAAVKRELEVAKNRFLQMAQDAHSLRQTMQFENARLLQQERSALSSKLDTLSALITPCVTAEDPLSIRATVSEALQMLEDIRASLAPTPQPAN